MGERQVSRCHVLALASGAAGLGRHWRQHRLHFAAPVAPVRVVQ
jgi:hypothetical protein